MGRFREITSYAPVGLHRGGLWCRRREHVCSESTTFAGHSRAA